MTLNCKAGDLAVIVRDDFIENIGVLVEVLRPAGSDFLYEVPTGSKSDWEVRPLSPVRAWNIDFTSSISEQGETIAYEDGDLRPIRDNDGEDETLQWAPVPTKETA